MGVTDKITAAAKDLKAKYDAGNKQTEGLGAELAARAEMNRQGAKALNGDDSADAAPPKAPAPKTDSGARYGDKAGEKRIDTSDMTKPLGSFAKGTNHVPKTGVYKIHEGEAVIPKEKNVGEHSPAEKKHFHRAMSKLHKGALHAHLGIPEGQPIPLEKKKAAANSDNPHVAAMGRMAVAMHGWKH